MAETYEAFFPVAWKIGTGLYANQEVWDSYIEVEESWNGWLMRFKYNASISVKKLEINVTEAEEAQKLINLFKFTQGV